MTLPQMNRISLNVKYLANNYQLQSHGIPGREMWGQQLCE